MKLFHDSRTRFGNSILTNNYEIGTSFDTWTLDTFSNDELDSEMAF